MDADTYLLNVENGTIDLRSGELREHRRDDLITKLAPVAYIPGASSERWESFLVQITGGDPELAAFLKRAVGYSLTGDTSEERLFFAHGPAASGKSSFLEALKAMLGDYAATADFETFLKKSGDSGVRNDIARLAGVRLVNSIEVDEGKQLAESLLKSLTGGDTVTARDQLARRDVRHLSVISRQGGLRALSLCRFRPERCRAARRLPGAKLRPVSEPASPAAERAVDPIDPGADIGHVHLKVADIERALQFWRDVLGFEVQETLGDSAAFLSAGGYHHHIGLNTWESRGGQPPPHGTTGLYHVAIRYPTRAALAHALKRLLDAGIRLEGASDHGVSEALYLRDFDGNGVELYWDRPRQQWPRTADGRLAMVTEKLDLRDLMAELERETPKAGAGEQRS